MNQPNDNAFRLKVIAVGSAVTAAIVAIAYLGIPQKPIDNTEKVEDLNNLKLAAELQKEAASTQNLPVLDGEKGYQRFCQQCHGETGIEKTPLSQTMDPAPTNLKFGPFKQAHNRGAILRIILEGFQNANGESTMPGFSGNMSQETAENIAKYTLSLRPNQDGQTQENKTPPVVEMGSEDTATENLDGDASADDTENKDKEGAGD